MRLHFKHTLVTFILCGAIIGATIPQVFAQSTTTITGNIKNLGTGAVSTGSFVRFYLRGCGGNLPRINGTAIIAPTLGNVYYFDFVPNSGGAISGTLYSSRDSTGLLGGAIECGGSTTAVWYGLVPFLNGKAGPEVPVHAKASSTLDVSNVTPIVTNPVITAPTGDSTYARLDGGNQNFTGAIGAPGISSSTTLSITGASTLTGPVTAGNINNIREIDGVKFAKSAAGINAADADCGAGTACVIKVPFPGTYSDTTIGLSKLHFLEFIGTGTYNVAGIIGPDSNSDVSATWGVRCPERAILFLANSSNRDVITDTNFLTLSGTGNTFGTFRVTIQGCQINGNKANQTALATRGTGTPSTVARTASGSGGVATIVMTGATSPAMAVGDTCNVTGITNDGSSFNGRFIAQSGTTASQLVVNQNTGKNTIASVAATGSGSVVCFSGSNGIRLFGRSYWIEDVTVANNVLDDIWVEGYTPSFVDDTSQLDSTIKRVRTINSGGDGIVFWGPQNSKMWDTTHFNHGQWGREAFQPWFDTNSVSFTNTSGSLHVGFGTAVNEQGSQESAASPPSSAGAQAILLDNGAGPSIFENMSVFCIACIGMEWRAGGQRFGGQLGGGNGTAQVTGLKFNGGSGRFDGQILNTSTFFDCTSVGAHSFLTYMNNDAIGTVGAASCAGGGNPLGLGSLTVIGYSNIAGNTDVVLPGSTIMFLGTGFTPGFPSSNGTLIAPDLAQTFSAVQHLGSNIVQLTADASPIAATTPGTTFLTFGALPVSKNFSFSCKILYNQQTAAGGVGLSVQGATNAPTRLDAWGNIFTSNAGVAAEGNAANITSTTATSVVTATPSAITTVFQADLNGTIQVGASTSTLNILMFTQAGADTVTPKAGSYCMLF